MAYQKATGRTLDDNEQLKNLGLLCCERDQLYPTYAAVLLSDSPVRRHIFPYAKIECARFKGTDTRVFLDQMSINVPVYVAVEPCLAFVKRNIALSSRIGEVYREDRWEYPLEAIREAISNAIIHRDYAILGSDIKVAIFDDLLEITSPGPLPETMPIEKLGTGRSEIRNRILAPIFKDLKLIEAWGTGIQKMQGELVNYPEIELVLKEAGHAFQVQFRKKPAAEPAAERVGLKLSHTEAGRVPDKYRISIEQTPDKYRANTGQVPGEYRTSTGQVPDKLKLLDFCREGRTIKEMMSHVSLKHSETFLTNYLHPLIRENLMSMTIPDKPRSPKQRYLVTTKGLGELEKLRPGQ
jgi:predicted HTH transcriptional regulator